MTTLTPDAAAAKLAALIAEGRIDPSCRTCATEFIPAVLAGKSLSEVWAPSHKALSSCRSGGHPHCTCDTCF